MDWAPEFNPKDVDLLRRTIQMTGRAGQERVLDPDPSQRIPTQFLNLVSKPVFYLKRFRSTTTVLSLKIPFTWQQPMDRSSDSST